MISNNWIQYLVLSVNIKTLIEEFKTDGKSLIYRLNNKGSKCEPWGTPDFTEISSDNEHDNLTNWLLSVR